MTKIAGSGSISQRHEFADPDPDPHQNVMDPEHWLEVQIFVNFKTYGSGSVLPMLPDPGIQKVQINEDPCGSRTPVTAYVHKITDFLISKIMPKHKTGMLCM